jgi:CBS domain-containing protein
LRRKRSSSVKGATNLVAVLMAGIVPENFCFATYQPKKEFLELAEQIVNSGKPHTLTVRDLLAHFYSERRGKDVVWWIKQKLQLEGLTTEPDFEIVYIDAEIELRKAEPPASKKGSSSNRHEPGGDRTYSPSQAREAVPRIGMVPAANRPPVTVSRDAPITEAITLMLMHDFSQLPVIQNERKVHGFVSWKSIGSRTAISKEPEFVRDCLDKSVEVLKYDLPLFEAVNILIRKEAVLIRGAEEKITGLVTTSDISEQFMELSLPFLILEQIENHIRTILGDRFSEEELKTAADPSDDSREIKTISDLTFGEYLRIIENPDHWGKLMWKLDRGTFVKRLDHVRRIRNEVMHFHPDGITPKDLELLRDTASFMQTIAPQKA